MVVIKKLIILGLICVVSILSMISVSAQDYLALQGSVTGATAGNVIVEIWSAATGGTLLYNSTTDFNNVISGGRYDILVGNGTKPLSLNFSGTYYMNLNIAGKDMNFNNSDRQVFQSPVGNITTSRPIKTSSTSTYALNVNDMLNISGADGNVTTAGSIKIQSTDSDDALNVSAGGAYIAGNTVFNKFFNITTTASAVRTNGTVTILNSDSDDALNISAGGAYFSGAVTMVNSLTGTTSGKNLLWAGKIETTNNDADDALNVTTGGAYIAGNTVFNKFFNITTTASAVRTNGTITILSADTDDALNVSAGGAYIEGATVINNDLTVSGGAFSSFSNKVLVSNNDADDALNVSAGGAYIAGNIVASQINVAGNSEAGFITANAGPETSSFAGKVSITNNDADDALNVSAGGAYFSGAAYVNNLLTANTNLQVNGQGIFSNNDGDDALNVSAGGAYIAGNTVFNKFFNITTTASAVRTNGTITILSADTDDALNVTTGGAYLGGNVVVGNGATGILNISTGASGDVFSVSGKFNVLNNGQLTILEGGPGDGKFIMYSSDEEDALNLTAGGANVNKNLTVGQQAIIGSNDADDALNVSAGGAYIEGATVINNDLTVSGGAFSSFSNKVLVSNNDADDALNVSAGGAYIEGATVINNDLTVSGGAYSSFSNQVLVSNNDIDDALNVTTGGVIFRGSQVQIGHNESTNKNHLDIFDGGAPDKCAYITMYDGGGVPWYFFVNTTGGMRITPAIPASCTTEGESIGSQP